MAPSLPVPVEPRGERPSLARTPSRAAFISQLIAERQHLPPQRLRRRSTVDTALGAYAATASSAVLRLPPGYRKTLTV